MYLQKYSSYQDRCGVLYDIEFYNENKEKQTYICTCNLISILGSYEDLRIDTENGKALLGLARRTDMYHLKKRIEERIRKEASQFGASSDSTCELYRRILNEPAKDTHFGYQGKRVYTLTRVYVPEE